MFQMDRPISVNYNHLTASFPGKPGWAGTRKVKPIWILLEQEIVSGSGISWAVCKSAPRSRQITMLAPHHSVFYRPDALPAAQPTASKHWRQQKKISVFGPWQLLNHPKLQRHSGCTSLSFVYICSSKKLKWFGLTVWSPTKVECHFTLIKPQTKLLATD